MKQLTIQSGDGEILTLEVPELSDCFPLKFQKAAARMSRSDCIRLAEAVLELSVPEEEEVPAPSPEEIADAARRGLSALQRISGG